MVNRGRSKGCVTCKQRRVKCDQAKPKCRTCHRLGLQCEGYQTRYSNLKFKDQNYKFCNESTSSRATRDKNQVSSPRALAEPDTSVSFFLQYYAGMGRSLGSARGFFEVLIPVYCSQTQDSPLILAVSAVASKILSLWRHDRCQDSREKYTQAVKCLRSTLKDHNEWEKPATISAVLSLQLYENIATIFGLHSGTSIHHNGALSLLPFASSDKADCVTHILLRRFILHSEICSAMRQERPLQDTAYSWVKGKDLIVSADNPSSRLDAIGATVAELQASYMQSATRHGSITSSQKAPRDWRIEAKRLDDRLLAWSRKVPDHWQPLKLRSGQDVDSSIPTYRSLCEVYPTCQIGTIWNLWRVQRLLLLRIILSSYAIPDPWKFDDRADEVSASDEHLGEYVHTLQELVDSVCHSVPFYLGNRSNPLNLADFGDTGILLPSSHSLAVEDEGVFDMQGKKGQTSREDYRRHIIAQGPWHIMSPLSRLLTLFSEGHGQYLASFLRPGQHEWIREQFLRVTLLLRIPLPGTSGIKRLYTFAKSPGQEPTDSEIEYLAKEVRKGAIFMSGP
ncbi:C6 zinc finger domain protein [Talaromyces proteolyticus]|uniref:C6 zinc finger domain protein n=1 Tax=Talaromyces proteolyticus TaxID=1131652 RepID=A0AAD4KU60_9EURO|nr:C6 zinc finger domain protein [Talaromyces proteolyticus]KAH8699317.1 C6 zinc finger domain protein [Talaromyces proteolyticus]